jgi:hypothetical protein
MKESVSETDVMDLESSYRHISMEDPQLVVELLHIYRTLAAI